MNKSFDDLQRMNQTGLDSAMRLFGEWSRGWQTLATEMTDYSKRSFEDGTATFEKLLAARSLEQAFEIQSGYAKRSYEQYMQQMSRIGTMYADIAKDAYRPMEKLMQGPR